MIYAATPGRVILIFMSRHQPFVFLQVAAARLARAIPYAATPGLAPQKKARGYQLRPVALKNQMLPLASCPLPFDQHSHLNHWHHCLHQYARSLATFQHLAPD